MRPSLIFILFIQVFPALAQVNDNGVFMDFPEYWTGDTAHFVFHPGEEELQLNAPRETGEAFIFTGTNVIEDAKWETGFHLDFNPSSANYLQIYLATDGDEDFQNGFYLVAGTTADNISLWERRSGEDRLLIEGEEDRLDRSPAIANIRVTRRRGGYWSLETDTGDGWQKEGEIRSIFGFAPASLGVSCHYTKTRCDKFFITSFSVSGEAYRDTIPPHVQSLEVINGHTLEVAFSEAVDENECRPRVTSMPGESGIHEIFYDEARREATIHLDTQLSDTDDGRIVLGGWCDSEGNVMADTSFSYSYLSPGVTEWQAEDYRHIRLCFNRDIDEKIVSPGCVSFSDTTLSAGDVASAGDNCFTVVLQDDLPDAREVDVYLRDVVLPAGDTVPSGPYPVYYHEAGAHDLVITEIMHDPSPPALLPEVEYIELFNRSDLPVDLNNMTLHVNSDENRMPEYVVFPGEYVVLYRKGDAGFPNGLPLDKWHALTNKGGEIVLRNPSGEVVTAFRYPGTMNGDSYKKQGGWSYEVIDPDNLSGSLSNRVYCQNEKGGTPGEENSVDGPNPDAVPPLLRDAWLENDSVLVLDFGEPVDNISGRNDVVRPAGPKLVCDTLTLEPVFGDRLYVNFKDVLDPDQVETLEITSHLTDLAGNHFEGPDTLRFGRPGAVDSFDIVINELLFDPPAEGGDYVELYNRSSRIADLDSLCLARDSDDGSPGKLVPLSDRTRWFLPGQHLCFAAEPGWAEEYFECAEPSYLRALPGLPNYVNDGGIVFLTRRNGRLIDRFDYSPGLHFSLLSETKAVALERTNPDSPTNSPSTWHSASSTVNYGTPAGPNSQLTEAPDSVKEPLFELSPDIFTPDMDGMDDRLIISYAFGEPGFKGTFVVYDAEGRLVRELVNNRSLGTSGQISWDGTDARGSLCPPGIYIVWARVFNARGAVKEYKASCVLGTETPGE